MTTITDLSGEILLRVKYTLDLEGRSVRIYHSDLAGCLGFEFSTPGLAHVQLRSLDETTEPLTELEEFLKDTQSLAEQIVKLKGKLTK